jgi:dTDP-4-dehydrorhamnose reductase
MNQRPDKPIAWITGAGGLIGAEIVRTAKEMNLPWLIRGLTREDFDLLNFSEMQAAFRRDKPALIIHCAALSRSPACEANPALARKANVEVTRHLAELCADGMFYFFSTDLIFDGEKGDYREEDTPNPLMVYGETKLEGEAVVSQHPHHLILRISLTGGISACGDRGFNEETRNAWRAGKSLKLFTDEFRCPMDASIPARAIWELASQHAVGTYHLNGAERLSRYEIGNLLAERYSNFSPTIEPTSRRNYTGAPRPADTSLNCDKISRQLSFAIPKFSEWLKTAPARF